MRVWVLGCTNCQEHYRYDAITAFLGLQSTNEKQPFILDRFTLYETKRPMAWFWDKHWFSADEQTGVKHVGSRIYHISQI
jgi:hypothetical protein